MHTKPYRHVLILEDCDEDFDTLVDTLSSLKLPLIVHRAVDGQDCLNQLESRISIGSETVELVLLDILTPGMDGRAALAIIKSDPKLRYIPIVILSGSSDPAEMRSSFAAGANAYHNKPFSYKDYRRTLENIFCYWLDQISCVG